MRNLIRSRTGGLGAVVLALAATACATINTRPFEAFSDSVRTLGTAVRQQVVHDYDAAYQEWTERIFEGDPAAVLDLQLSFDQRDTFAFGYQAAEEPLHVKLDRFQRGVKELNDAMTAYADLLLRLADKELVPPDVFDELAREIDAKAASASTTLGQDLPANQRAFFSTATVEILQQIIDSKRRKKLREAIRKQQPTVQRYANSIRAAIDLVAQGIKERYTDEFPGFTYHPDPDAVSRKRG